MKFKDDPEVQQFSCHGFSVTKVRVKTDAVGKRLKKEMGDYITIDSGDLFRLSSALELGDCLSEILEPILSPYYGKRLCICGLGNQDIVADSLGPTTINKLPAYFLETTYGKESKFKKQITIKPDIQNNTNISTELLISGLVKAAKADCLILIDSIATHEKENFCTCVQISTAGGTAHAMASYKADWSIAGVPIISIGVPVAFTLEPPNSNLKYKNCSNWFTHSNIQEIIELASAVIAYALVKISYPGFEEKDYIMLTEIKNPSSVLW